MCNWNYRTFTYLQYNQLCQGSSLPTYICFIKVFIYFCPRKVFGYSTIVRLWSRLAHKSFIDIKFEVHYHNIHNSLTMQPLLVMLLRLKICKRFSGSLPVYMFCQSHSSFCPRISYYTYICWSLKIINNFVRLFYPSCCHFSFPEAEHTKLPNIVNVCTSLSVSNHKWHPQMFVRNS